MSDFSTFAGQAAHYADVRARLMARPLQVPSRRAAIRAPVAAPKPEPLYGVPVNLICPPNARIIVKLVSLRSGAKVDDIVGPRRDKAIVPVRQQAIRLIHSHCSHLSLPAIGRIFNRDHTTILYQLGTLKRSPHCQVKDHVVPTNSNGPQERGLTARSPEHSRANHPII